MAVTANKQITFLWEGKDKKGKVLKGEIRAAGEAVVNATLRRQGITVTKVKKQSAFASKGKITDKDITLFTRQLATMMKAGVPLLQALHQADSSYLLDFPTKEQKRGSLNDKLSNLHELLHPAIGTYHHVVLLTCNNGSNGKQIQGYLRFS